MSTSTLPRRLFALAAKIALAVALVVAVFWSARFRCWGGGCTCTPQIVDTYMHPYSRSGALAVNSTTGLLYSSADDAMAVAVFDVDHVMNGPLFSVPTEGYLTSVALDETTNKLYFVQGFSKSVRVIDGATHDHHDIAVRDVKNALGSTVVDPVRHRLYVVRSDDFDIAVFDTVSERSIGAVGKGCCSTPDIRLAVDTTTGLLFVLDTAEGRLSAFSAEDPDDRSLAVIDVGGVSTRMVVDSARSRAYISQDEPQQLVVVDVDPSSPTAFSMIAQIVLRDRPGEIAIDPASHLAYVSNTHTDTLSLIDLAANRWIMDTPIGYQPSVMAVDPTTARVYVALNIQGVGIVQGCPAVHRGLAGSPRPSSQPASGRGPRVVTTPVDHGKLPEAAARLDYVRCERMFRIRTNCVEGPATHEGAMATADIEASGARVVDRGAAGQYCGVAPDNVERDLAAAGFYYSVPVVEAGAAEPSVWTFASATRTMLAEEATRTLRVARVEAAPESPWREALWWLSRCKTRALGEACCR